MKNIDIKSLIIGALLTSTIFLGVAATSPTDKWDEKQSWVVLPQEYGANHKDGFVLDLELETKKGFEPINVDGRVIWYRKRLK